MVGGGHQFSLKNISSSNNSIVEKKMLLFLLPPKCKSFFHGSTKYIRYQETYYGEHQEILMTIFVCFMMNASRQKSRLEVIGSGNAHMTLSIIFILIYQNKKNAKQQ